MVPAQASPRRSLAVALLRATLGVGTTVGLLTTAAPAAAAGDGPVKTITYSVGAVGMRPASEKASHFRAVVAATLNDPRGWSLNGRVRFRPGRHSAFRVTLTAPSVLGRLGGCSAFWSCRVGHSVLINNMRWERGSSTFPGPARLHPYRQMVINHEVGHALGFGHGGCHRPGAMAPVMQQQSKSLNGCRANPWPSAGERSQFARRMGIAVGQAPPRLTLGRSAGGVLLGDRRSDVLARLGRPEGTHTGTRTRTDEYPSVLRLRVEYLNGRVSALVTRSPSDRTVTGLGVGVSRSRLRTGACTTSSDRLTRCVIGRARDAGDTPTTFVLRDGHVVAVRIERLETAPAVTPPISQEEARASR